VSRLCPRLVLTLFVLALAACRAPAANTPAGASASPRPTLSAPATSPAPAATAPTATVVPTRTSAPTFTPSATATAVPSATPTISPTADPYAGLYVDDLRARSYTSTLTVLDTIRVTAAFTRSLISYTSDGLTIYGFMNMPRGQGPFPVVLVLHGYIDPGSYDSLTYMTRYTDPLAAAGFLVIHPDYRGYGRSDAGANPFRIGYAVDVLNLIAAVEQLPQAQPGALGIFGHSMGGGIGLRAITVSPQVKAALLYGSMSGDEHANFVRIAEWRADSNLPELFAPPEAVARISPINALDHITAAVSLHHGDADLTVPPAWTADLYARLLALGKAVEYYTYPGQPHTFAGDGQTLLLERAVSFFRRKLVAQP
jgi:dipeptidyl aminopeptidase/acylaminoacyl peptidase